MDPDRADFDEFSKLVRSRRTSMIVDQTREVPIGVIAELCALATWAPNHKKTWPWRFAVFTGAGRTRLGDTMADEMERVDVRRRRQTGQDPREIPSHAGDTRRRVHTGCQ